MSNPQKPAAVDVRNVTPDGLTRPLGRVVGFAPGNYLGTCAGCGKPFQGDKRAMQCLNCAIDYLVANVALARAPFDMNEITFSKTGSDVILAFEDVGKAVEAFEFLADNSHLKLAFISAERKLKFREHRGSLVESMLTTVEVGNRAGLMKHLRQLFLNSPAAPDLGGLEFKPYGGDERVPGWEEMWIVVAPGFGPLGFTNGSAP